MTSILYVENGIISALCQTNKAILEILINYDFNYCVPQSYYEFVMKCVFCFFGFNSIILILFYYIYYSIKFYFFVNKLLQKKLQNFLGIFNQ